MEKEKIFMKRLALAMSAADHTKKSLYLAIDGAISVSMIERYLKGENEPGARYLRILCRELDVSSDWLIGAIDAEDPVPLPKPWDRSMPDRRGEVTARRGPAEVAGEWGEGPVSRR